MKLISFVFGLFLCLNAFAEASGVFVFVQGKVYIENLKKEISQAKVKSVIYPGETVWADTEGKAKIVMSDRNVINVLPGTKLKFEVYTNEANSKIVDLQLMEGRIRLDVKEKYEASEKSKFEVKTPVAIAGVRGTEFIISHTTVGNVTKVSVLSGKVHVDRIGTLKDIMGFGKNGQVIVNSQQQLEVKKGASGEAEVLKGKALDLLKKETEIDDGEESSETSK